MPKEMLLEIEICKDMCLILDNKYSVDNIH